MARVLISNKDNESFQPIKIELEIVLESVKDISDLKNASDNGIDESLVMEKVFNELLTQLDID